MSILTIKDLSFDKKNKNILNKINFNLENNSINLLIGPNGSGKTTLLKSLCGLIKYTGSIYLKNKELKDYSKEELSKIIAWVPNRLSNHLPYTVLDIVIMGRFPWNKGFPSLRDKLEAREVLKRLEINFSESQKIPTLSAGELQKIHIARAFYSYSSFILLDEPSSNLDLKSQISLFKNIKMLHQTGKTVLFSDHNIHKKAHGSINTVLALKNGKNYFHLSSEKALVTEKITSLFALEKDEYEL